MRLGRKRSLGISGVLLIVGATLSCKNYGTGDRQGSQTESGADAGSNNDDSVKNALMLEGQSLRSTTGWLRVHFVLHGGVHDDLVRWNLTIASSDDHLGDVAPSKTPYPGDSLSGACDEQTAVFTTGVHVPVESGPRTAHVTYADSFFVWARAGNSLTVTGTATFLGTGSVVPISRTLTVAVPTEGSRLRGQSL